MRSILLGLMASTLCACATGPKTVNFTDTAVLSGKNLGVIEEEGFVFSIWPKAKSGLAAGVGALGGPIGAGIGGAVSVSMDIERGKKAVKDYGLNSPSFRIERELKTALSAKYGLILSSETINFDATEKPNNIKKLGLKPSHIYLDSQSSFGVVNKRMNIGSFIRIMDGTDGSVLASHICNDLPIDKDSSPTYTDEELRANNGALMRAELESHADRCIAQVRAILINVPVVPAN